MGETLRERFDEFYHMQRDHEKIAAQSMSPEPADADALEATRDELEETRALAEIVDCLLEEADSLRAQLSTKTADILRLLGLLECCYTILANMALENRPGGPLSKQVPPCRRWQISDESLRNDAKNILPLLIEALE
jgi:hypothetical protein